MGNLIDLNRMCHTAKEVRDREGLGTWLNRIMTLLLYQCLSAPGIVIGSGDASKVKQTNTVVYLNNGIFKSRATQETAFTATTHDITDGYEATFLITLQADGTCILTKGDEVLGTGGSIAPAVPAGETLIGTLVLSASGAAFNATTDDLSDGHLTDTYSDCITPLNGASQFKVLA